MAMWKAPVGMIRLFTARPSTLTRASRSLDGSHLISGGAVTSPCYSVRYVYRTGLERRERQYEQAKANTTSAAIARASELSTTN